MEALDLTNAPPRSPFVELGGLVLLARTIDKLRAELPGGKVGEFHFSSMSEDMCRDLGITHDALLDVVRHAAHDDEVVAWVHANTDAARYDAVNAALLGRKVTDENRERLTKKYPVLAEHPETESLFAMLDLDDAAQFGSKRS